MDLRDIIEDLYAQQAKLLGNVRTKPEDWAALERKWEYYHNRYPEHPDIAGAYGVLFIHTGRPALGRPACAPGSSGVPGGNPAQLAHGISVALYNTAFGLIVAIPSLIFWRYFRVRVDEYLLTLELSAERFVRHLIALRQS